MHELKSLETKTLRRPAARSALGRSFPHLVYGEPAAKEGGRAGVRLPLGVPGHDRIDRRRGDGDRAGRALALSRNVAGVLKHDLNTTAALVDRGRWIALPAFRGPPANLALENVEQTRARLGIDYGMPRE